jgi:hypothetical protein
MLIDIICIDGQIQILSKRLKYIYNSDYLQSLSTTSISKIKGQEQEQEREQEQESKKENDHQVKYILTTFQHCQMHVVTKLINAIDDHEPIQWNEYNDMKTFLKYFDCLRLMTNYKQLNVKWIDDIFTFVRFVSQIMMNINCDFTSKNMVRSSWSINLILPWRINNNIKFEEHQYRLFNNSNSSGNDENDNNNNNQTNIIDEKKNILSSLLPTEQEILYNAMSLPNESIDFLKRCIYNLKTAPGASKTPWKLLPQNVQSFEFKWKKNDVSRMDDVEDIVDKFIAQYFEKFPFHLYKKEILSSFSNNNNSSNSNNNNENVFKFTIDNIIWIKKDNIKQPYFISSS